MDDNRLDRRLPTSRADPELLRERTGIRLGISVVPPKVELDVHTDGLGRDPASVAATMLLVTVSASIPAVLLGVIGWLIRMRGLPLAAAVLGLFIALFATVTIMTFRGRQEHLRPQVPALPVITAPESRTIANGSASANGSAGTSGHKGSRGRGRAKAAGR